MRGQSNLILLTFTLQSRQVFDLLSIGYQVFFLNLAELTLLSLEFLLKAVVVTNKVTVIAMDVMCDSSSQMLIALYIVRLSQVVTMAMMAMMEIVLYEVDLRYKRWAWTIGVVACVKVMLVRKVLHHIVSRIKRTTAAAVVGQQRVIATIVTAITYPWSVTNVHEVVRVPVAIVVMAAARTHK